jgi:hypothetical protein
MNRNLGNYDMVLALSSNKINYQFKKMYQRKIIHNEWAFLTNSMGKEVKTLTNQDAVNYWANIDVNKANLDNKKTALKLADQQMTAAISAKKWAEVEELSAKKEGIQAEVDALQREIDQANLYDLGLIANIAEPKIEIISDATKELIFQISFKAGSTLFYTREGKKAEYDLGANGIKYAFRVSIGKVKITADKKIVEISENGTETDKTLRDKGINDNDFTIQSLFLDFENANIANYDAQKSQLPKAASDNALLQAVMVNYFKSLAHSDNPYVLGYSIYKNEVQEGERGLFYPTGVAYSTSFSKEQRASTFNFLMLLNNHTFPNGNDAGVLPSSLMERAIDTTETVNGVFGLDLREFEENYISLLSHLLHEKIKDNLGDSYRSSRVNNKDISLEFWLHNVSGRMDLAYQGIRNNNSSNGVDIVYAIRSEASVHQEIEQMFGTVGVDWDVSTSGKANCAPDGHEGQLLVTLTAGASGKLDLRVNYAQAFKLGFRSSTPRYKNGWDEAWDNINKAIASMLSTLLTIELDIGKNINNLVHIDNIGQALNIQQLERLDNKVILPVSSVYTYKNVRILSDSTNQNSILLFDTSYGTVAQ